MAVRFWNREYVFLNSLRVPRAFGKVYAYDTESSTPIDTFSDDGLTTANLNPITLNLVGRLSVDVFGSAVDYKFIVTNADGTDSITIDPVHGGLEVNDFLITATGTTEPRSLADRFADAVNVLDYGAIGDDATDATAAVASALATGLDVILPNGTYLISDTLLMSTPYQTLHGNGMLSQLHFVFNLSKPGIEISSSTGRQAIRNVYLNGTSNVSKLISVKSPQVTISDSRLVNTDGHVVYAENENGGSGVYAFGLGLLDSYVYGNLTTGNYGVRLGLNSQTARIIGNAIENCGTLIKIEGAAHNVNIIANVIERSIDYAIDLDKSAASPLMASINIEGNWFEENLICVHAKGGEFNDLSIRKNRATASSTSNSYFYFAEAGSSAASDDIYVEENYIENFDTFMGLSGEYSSRIRGSKGNTFVNVTNYSYSTYLENAYDIEAVNPYAFVLASGATLSIGSSRLESKTGVYIVPLSWDSRKNLEKVTIRYVTTDGTGMTAQLMKVQSAGDTETEIATSGVVSTDSVITLTAGGYGDNSLNYFLKLTFDNTNTSGYAYAARQFFRK